MPRPRGNEHRRVTTADVLELAKLSAARGGYASEPKVELDFKRPPGGDAHMTSWHIEIVAGFDNREVDRVVRKAIEVHKRLLREFTTPAPRDAHSVKA